MLKMRDISSYQGEPNLLSLDCQIIAIKATEGTGYKSPTFQAMWAQAKKDKLARMAYHFLHPSISGVAQARFFLDSVKNAGLETGDLLALDLEDSDGLGAAEVATVARVFTRAVEEEVKCSVVVYTYLDFANRGNCVGLEYNPLWIAEPSSPAGQPVIPKPWKVWSFHQYGIVRGVDADVANFQTVEQLDKIGVLTGPPPLQPNQRNLILSDGTMTVERVVNIDNLVHGFHLEAGDSSFRITG